jgi:uncharacterized membrane protein HdeD (DUF308 family)
MVHDPREARALKSSANSLLLEAVILLLLGTIAILVPAIFSLAITTIIGALLAVGGVIRLFRCTRTGAGWEAFAALLAAAAGIVILVFPLGGLLWLTIVLIALFLLEGVAKVVAALRHRPRHAWGWGLISGLVDIALGIILWLLLPLSALWAIGLLVGVSLLMTGWAAIMFSLGMRRLADEAGA